MRSKTKAPVAAPAISVSEHKSTHYTKNLIAQQVAISSHRKLEPEQIEANSHAILSAREAYGAKGSVVSLVFYLKFQLEISNGGKTFDGKAWGVSFPGGGALFGDVYTDDLDRLYADTESFQFTGTPVYFSVVFFDADGNALGTFQAGALSTVIGTGGGGGRWS